MPQKQSSESDLVGGIHREEDDPRANQTHTESSAFDFRIAEERTKFKRQDQSLALGAVVDAGDGNGRSDNLDLDHEENISTSEPIEHYMKIASPEKQETDLPDQSKKQTELGLSTPEPIPLSRYDKPTPTRSQCVGDSLLMGSGMVSGENETKTEPLHDQPKLQTDAHGPQKPVGGKRKDTKHVTEPVSKRQRKASIEAIHTDSKAPEQEEKSEGIAISKDDESDKNFFKRPHPKPANVVIESYVAKI